MLVQIKSHAQRLGVFQEFQGGHLKIGIDLGGTKIEGVVLDERLRVTARLRIPTEAQQGPEHIISRIAGLVHELKKSNGIEHAAIGVGTPGALAKKTGLLKNSNTVCLNGYPLKDALEVALKQPIRVENDANCFALAESILGAGRGYECVFGVIMGTGCGGGIVLNQKIRSGPQSLAGEWGHMTLDPNGPLCYCGARGCVETFISGSGIEKMHLAQTGVCVSSEKILNSDAPEFSTTQQGFYQRFGSAVANLIAVLDPDIIVLGGGLSNLPGLYDRGVAEVRSRIFGGEMTTPIVQHELGDSAGVIGAALLAP